MLTLSSTTVEEVDIRTEELPYRWCNVRGDWVETSGMLYLPDDGDGPWPLLMHAGYEAPAELGQSWTALGVALVTPRLLPDDGEWPHGNPLGRSLRMDEALLRAARRLNCVDDSKVALTGGSAGGWMTLMLSASTFPLAGAFPVCPPVNLPYQISAWRHNLDAIRAHRPESDATVMLHPGSPEICGLWQSLVDWHGEPEDRAMWQWSPLAHLAEITCPVYLWVSSADALVPIPQYGGPLVEGAIEGAPEVYPIDPAVVCSGTVAEVGKRTLLGELDPDEVRVHVLGLPPDVPRLLDVNDPPPGGVTLEAPEPLTRWTVVFVDEGAPDEDVGHFKHVVGVDTAPLVLKRLAGIVELEQLTAPKLEVLVMRWLSRDWIGGGAIEQRPAEEREDEQADVLRGLRTYAAQSPAHRARLVEVVAQVRADLRHDAEGLWEQLGLPS